MGRSEREAHCSVRFSLGAETTAGDIDFAVNALREIVEDPDPNVRFVPCR